MSSSTIDSITLKAPFDAHVHLRQAGLMKLVVPHVERGGVRSCYVMPNLIPPLTTPQQSIDYLKQLQSLAPSTQFLMSMYLNTSLTPSMIHEAHRMGVVGVKSYPRGVTTNSEGGVGMEGYSTFYPIFEAMQECDMVLNLHGEVPSDVDHHSGDGSCVMNAEERFLPHLLEIHQKFPKLRIVLEHCTTAAAVECVKTLPPNVCATITPHHLLLTIDQAVSSSLNFCKPIAKYPSDRHALRSVIASGHPQFFLGSDSAPHPSGSKLPTLMTYFTKRIDPATKQEIEEEEVVLPSPCAAGIYTQADLIPMVATIFGKTGISIEDHLENYVSNFGRKFYKIQVEDDQDSITLRRAQGGKPVENSFGYQVDADKNERVIPFLAGDKLDWEIVKS